MEKSRQVEEETRETPRRRGKGKPDTRKGKGAATANGHIAPKTGDLTIYEDGGKQHTETW